jgi:hypothetical protein
MAQGLGRAPSTISCEITGIGGPARYRAGAVELRACRAAGRPKPTRLATFAPLRRLVDAKFRLRWSPAQIAGWLGVMYPDDPQFYLSHETIYRSLFVQARGVLRQVPTGICGRGARCVGAKRRVPSDSRADAYGCLHLDAARSRPRRGRIRHYTAYAPTPATGPAAPPVPGRSASAPRRPPRRHHSHRLRLKLRTERATLTPDDRLAQSDVPAPPKNSGDSGVHEIDSSPDRTHDGLAAVRVSVFVSRSVDVTEASV